MRIEWIGNCNQKMTSEFVGLIFNLSAGHCRNASSSLMKMVSALSAHYFHGIRWSSQMIGSILPCMTHISYAIPNGLHQSPRNWVLLHSPRRLHGYMFSLATEIWKSFTKIQGFPPNTFLPFLVSNFQFGTIRESVIFCPRLLLEAPLTWLRWFVISSGSARVKVKASDGLPGPSCSLLSQYLLKIFLLTASSIHLILMMMMMMMMVVVVVVVVIIPLSALASAKKHPSGQCKVRP